MSNLAFLTNGEKNQLLEEAKEIGGIDKKNRIEEFCKSKTVDRFIQTIKMEKPHFRKKIDPFDLAFVLSVTPKKLHARIKAQDGAFLLFGLVENDTGIHLENCDINEISVDAKAKERILQELSVIGISEQVLFPEIEKTAQNIKSRYS
ncbi:hypothetical protein [Profundibacter sp.]